MSNIAIITARGGSKRIPRKNIKPFLGRPIIEYSILAALKAGIYDEVMVSTDDEEIASIAKNAGATVPFLRSESTSNDFATTAEVLMEVFTEYQKIGKSFNYASCIYPTAPFVTAEKLRIGMKKLKEYNGNILVPVVKFSFPPQRCFISDGRELSYKYPEYRNSRSQDLEPLYHDCGQFYCYHVANYIENKGQFDTGIIPLLLPELEVQDIDNEDDWKIAEIKYQLMASR